MSFSVYEKIDSLSSSPGLKMSECQICTFNFCTFYFVDSLYFVIHNHLLVKNFRNYTVLVNTGLFLISKECYRPSHLCRLSTSFFNVQIFLQISFHIVSLNQGQCTYEKLTFIQMCI